MDPIPLLNDFCAYGSLFFALIGCFLLHFRQRSGPSLAFLVSATSLCVWVLGADLIFALALDGTAILGLAQLRLANEIVEPLLILFVAISFAMSMHRVVRPNNSFKPNPLRGSA
jgi:hypothetical protein